MNQKVPQFLGPLLIIGSILMMIYGEPSPGVPHWIGYVACSTFLLAGLILIPMSLGYEKITTQLSNFLGPLIISSFAVIGTWIAFSPDGSQNCRGGLSMFGLSLWKNSGLECRAAFGFGAILTWIFLIAVLVSFFRKKQP